MKYKLCEWEDNGYHDSYFYGVYYDTDDGLMHSCGLGATAYCGGVSPAWQECQYPSLEIVECARLLLADHIFTVIRAAEHSDVMDPEDAKVGEVLQLLVPHTRQLKKVIPCHRCMGKCYWQNPRDPKDRRKCFACDGTGAFAKGDAIRDANGKIARETIPAGTRLTTLKVVAYGSFYRKGYNKPGRENRTVTGRTDAGDVISIPLKKLRLARDPMPDSELRARAVTLSHDHQYGAMFGCRAWLSDNYAAAAVAKAKAAA